MDIETAIKWLQEYKDKEQHLIIAWWDKDTSGYTLTDDQWKEVIKYVDKQDGFRDISVLIDEAVAQL